MNTVKDLLLSKLILFNHDLPWEQFINLTPKDYSGHYSISTFKIKDLILDLKNYLSKFFLVEQIGPYLNITFKEEDLVKNIEKNFSFPKKKILLEFSQPNTHKILHIGHMRNLCYGHSLSLILKFLGHEVINCTYPGDHGSHVAKCLWYLKKFPQEPEDNPGEFLGKIYSLAVAYTDEHPEVSEEVSLIQQELLDPHSETYHLWEKTRNWSLNLMRDVYEYAEVYFDRWYYESEEEESSISYVKELLKEGFLEESEGAIGKNLKDENLGFALLLKKDGNSLYLTKDLVLAKKKQEEFNPDENYYLVDSRQEFHFKQLFSLLHKLHYKNLFHLKYDVVELPSGAMSSRKGNFLGLRSFLQHLENNILTDYLQHKPWPEEEKAICAKELVNGAIKYGMLKVDPQKKVIFNEKEWTSLEGDTGIYLQYTATRIQALLKKESSSEEKNYSYNAKEKNLLFKLHLFPETVYKVSLDFKPNLLTQYLYQLCKDFNSYYSEYPILKEKKRIKLTEKVFETLKQGLSLLGISVPKRM